MDTNGLPGGYRLIVNDDLSYEIENADGKRLASVPDKLRGAPQWKQFLELRQNHRARVRNNTRAIVGWMVSGEAIPVETVTASFADPGWRAPLHGLLVEREGAPIGFVVAGEAGRGLDIRQRDGSATTLSSGTVTVPHPARLGELDAWRDALVRDGVRQGTEQLLRPLHRGGDRELPERKTQRFAGRTLENAARVSHAFNDRGWATAGGTARRTFTVYRDGAAPERVVAAFDYFAGGLDYGDWAQECETGALAFHLPDAGDGDAELMQVRDVSPVIFSEACLDIEAILAAG